MLSSNDLERLITEKRREIEKEKTVLGLSHEQTVSHVKLEDDSKEDSRSKEEKAKPKRSVSFSEGQTVKSNVGCDEGEERDYEIPPDLERYIRRYLGLPVMLKAGEYSPNNPLLRAERASGGDALLGLGEYERRRNTLRKIRQQQYREYLDEQAKKKQEAKERAERERREREERERQEEEKERRARETENANTELRRASVCYVPDRTLNRREYRSKVDTGVQVGNSRPLSVAVQTDDSELYRLSSSPSQSQLTQAERELSPRTVVESNEDRPLRSVRHDDRPIKPATWTINSTLDKSERRRSYGDFYERSSSVRKKSNRDKLVSDLRHTYMPSILDADGIQMRNQIAEQEAAERRQFYQQELKNQILEQQRIREERKTREKMLEQAEMRRLEEQLRMLRSAQQHETEKQHYIDDKMKENAIDFEKKRTSLQKDIDNEHQKLLRATVQPQRTTTSHSDTTLSKLPFFYPSNYEKYYSPSKEKHYSPNDKKPFSPDNEKYYSPSNEKNYPNNEKHFYSTSNEKHYSPNDKKYTPSNEKHFYSPTNEKLYPQNEKPYSTNIPSNSIFNPNYDVESYLRKNLNPSKESLLSHRLSKIDIDRKSDDNLIIEKALIHDEPNNDKRYKPSFLKNIENTCNIDSTLKNIDSNQKDIDFGLLNTNSVPKNLDRVQKISESIPNSDEIIPVLRHSPKNEISFKEDDLSEKMKQIDDKWKVPIVQKNILKSLPDEKGRNVSILTQLGSIRRQLQLEQLRLDGAGK